MQILIYKNNVFCLIVCDVSILSSCSVYLTICKSIYQFVWSVYLTICKKTSINLSVMHILCRLVLTLLTVCRTNFQSVAVDCWSHELAWGLDCSQGVVTVCPTNCHEVLTASPTKCHVVLPVCHTDFHGVLTVCPSNCQGVLLDCLSNKLPWGLDCLFHKFSWCLDTQIVMGSWLSVPLIFIMSASLSYSFVFKFHPL